MLQFPVIEAVRYRRRRRRDPSLPAAPRSIPWSLVAAHEAQALRNHYQTVERLAQRGGLSPAELVAVLEDRPWTSMAESAAIERLTDLVVEFEAVDSDGVVRPAVADELRESLRRPASELLSAEEMRQRLDRGNRC